MANDFEALDDFRLDDLRNDPLWAPFEMDLAEEDFPGVDTLLGDLGTHQSDVPSATTGPVAESRPDCGKAGGDHASLDMNDPAVLNDYASLLLFANNPSAHYLDIVDCSSFKQTTIQSLAVRLDLEYFYDDSIGIIQLRKDNYGEAFGERPQQPRLNQAHVVPSKGDSSLPSLASKTRDGMETRNNSFSQANKSLTSLHENSEMDIDTTSGNRDSWKDTRQLSLVTLRDREISEDELGFRSANLQLTPSLPRQSPWVELSRTLKEVGACWRSWGLIDIMSAKEVLRIKSAEHTLEVMKAAITYEKEYGLSHAVSIAIECFRNCIEILRLHDGGHLVSELHNDCRADHCQVQPFQNLDSNIRSFTDELSKVIFRKENRLHDRRWWLSTFYSLWIQSYVRRTIQFMKEQSKRQGHPELSSEMQSTCSAYLLLALELFDAASASFDPLVSTWSLEEEPPNMDLRLMKYYRLAQKALLSDQLMCDVGSSTDYLRRLYHDCDTASTTYSQKSARPSSMLSPGNTATENNRASGIKMLVSQSAKVAESDDRFSVPLRTRSGAKRRAGSPLQDIGFIRRNGSSSGMLDSRDIRSRGFSITSPGSPMSSAYSFAYGTSSSTKWNGSAESLAEMAKLYGTSPPNARDQFDYLSPSKGHRPALHHKSSNESFLELPRTLNKRRPASSTTTGCLGGLFACECCPKKPKRFDTIEELRYEHRYAPIGGVLSFSKLRKRKTNRPRSAHEAEKQYQCSFCGNRFKSKNEAERHRNSLHVRRHAWSCSAIQNVGYESVFQESINQPGVADACGYCGEDFGRSGGNSVFRQTNEEDWNERHNHLREVHKFGECNSAKRFYRADHFRQHLKHSHAGVSGRWANGLENMGMIELAE
ncbi:hypothetical protein AAE478_009498 [Parahypoxylon ruwenzoriense]